MKQCKYCGNIINGQAVNGCCNKLHEQLWKIKYNRDYYARSKLNNQIVEHAYKFKTLLDEFGEDVDINPHFMEILKFNWKLETHKVEIDGIEYIAIGNYAYIITKNKKIRIKRL